MGLVEKHPKDKGKYQSTFDTYGHGKGNGKSRAAVYKHHKKYLSENVQDIDEPFTQNVEDVEAIDETVTQNVEDESIDWEEISWLNEEDIGEDGEEITRPTIPKPIRKLSQGGPALDVAQRATQSKLVRWSYVGIDRALSHWGKGVLQDDKWEVKRHEMDYDALEGATMNMMDANGISINLSPNLVFFTVLGVAYIPPITEVASKGKNMKQSFFRILTSPFRIFKRRKKVIAPIN